MTDRSVRNITTKKEYEEKYELREIESKLHKKIGEELPKPSLQEKKLLLESAKARRARAEEVDKEVVKLRGIASED